jgi:hypothetical protein
MQNKTKHCTICVVWGPTIEWGDGVGPLGYFKTRKDAEGYLEELRQREKEEGKWAWRSVEECGHVQEWDARELGFDENAQTLDEFIDEMNSHV